MQHVTIQGRTYDVVSSADYPYAGRSYVLAGPSGGAALAVQAYADDPTMFKVLVGRAMTELRIRGNAVRLTDAGGTLRDATSAADPLTSREAEIVDEHIGELVKDSWDDRPPTRAEVVDYLERRYWEEEDENPTLADDLVAAANKIRDGAPVAGLREG